MTQQPTKEQVLDALQTHKTVQKAANALHVTYPDMQKYLRKYGIVCNRKAKEYDPFQVSREQSKSAVRSITAMFRNLFRKGGN